MSESPPPQIPPTSRPNAVPPVLGVSPDVFDGDRKKFPLFLVKFGNFVNRRLDTRGFDKVILSTKFLYDESKDLVRCLKPIDASFAIAISLLKEYYWRVDILI